VDEGVMKRLPSLPSLLQRRRQVVAVRHGAQPYPRGPESRKREYACALNPSEVLLRRRLALIVSIGTLLLVMGAPPASSAVVVKGVACSSCTRGSTVSGGTCSGMCGKVVVG
jgi:hypothetical protein